MNLDHNTSLAAEADRYRTDKRLVSWEADPATAESAASTLASSIGEHKGRWLYELLQNAEDAGSSHCEIRLDGSLLTVTDIGNKKGVPADAVESLSNPFVTTKVDSTCIGRKGIGFCSAYELTDEPFIWSRGSGVRFSKKLTAKWLEDSYKLTRISESLEDFPYLHALVPFGLHSPPEELPCSLQENLDTTIGLPLKNKGLAESIIKHFGGIDHRFLLTFQNLRRVTLHIDDRKAGELRKSNARNTLVATRTLRLLKMVEPGKVQRERYFASLKKIDPPTHILENSVPSRRDRHRLYTAEVGIFSRELRGTGKPSKVGSNIFVYYPTEETIPLIAMIHGDFLLDGSRKHLNDHAEGSLNRWLIDQATKLLIETANGFSARGNFHHAVDLIASPSGTKAEDFNRILTDFRERVSREFLLPSSTGTGAGARCSHGSNFVLRYWRSLAV